MNLIKIIPLLCGFCVICCDFCECSLVYTKSSTWGIFAAIAVPINLPHHNVFISYNFEANYNLPPKWYLPQSETAGIPIDAFVNSDEEDARLINVNGDIHDELIFTNMTGALKNVTSDDAQKVVNTEHPISNSEESEKVEFRLKSRRRRDSFLTRKHFYHVLKENFQRHGYAGEPCMLRLICEINSTDLGDLNGVLGSLLHIIFSPSTSIYEKLPVSYYQAELDGKHEMCHFYESKCPENILDLISVPLHDLLQTYKG